MPDTSPESGRDAGRGGLDWYGLPPVQVVRSLVGLLLAAVVAVLGALVLGEYQFEGALPVASGVLFGLVVAEVALGVGRRPTWPPALTCAALAAGGLVWAGWISAGEGLNPIAGGAWLAAALSAPTAIVRFAPWRRRAADSDAGFGVS